MFQEGPSLYYEGICFVWDIFFLHSMFHVHVYSIFYIHSKLVNCHWTYTYLFPSLYIWVCQDRQLKFAFRLRYPIHK